MSQKHTGSIVAILVVLVIAACNIIDPAKLFRSDLTWAQKVELKPGIDIAGGTSLLYEIKIPEGGYHGEGTLAEQVAKALKKRVDPNGIRNLVWRPQGANRLEIQIPRSAQSDRAAVVQHQFVDAELALDQLNVRTSDVIRAIEKLKEDERSAKLMELAGGSATRQKLFDEMKSACDLMQTSKVKVAEAEKAGDFNAQVAAARAQLDAEKSYQDLKTRVDATNLREEELKSVLDMTGDDRKAALDKLKAKFTDFPRRIAAIDSYISASEELKKLNGAIDSAADLKRLLKGSGVLEFHMLVPTGQFQTMATDMLARMKPGGAGPARQGGDESQWFLLDRQDQLGGGHIMATWNGKQYVLGWIIPTESMVHPTNPNEPNWSLIQVGTTQDQKTGGAAVSFSFDPEGAKLFRVLTGTHVPHNGQVSYLAIVLDNKIISAPTIQSEIGANGIITGGQGGYSQEELRYLVNTLAAGSLPAQLADTPISERTVSPQLGADNLLRGLISSGIGLVVVTVFLCSYYYLAGMVATCAVFMNLIIILGALSMFGATFTMPSIAGLVLTVGTAVDANVLIFERLREEQHRGLSLRMALHNAYDRAASAIVDSNMTTVITSFFLYAFGTEEVKGFGLTLLIGIASSMFTALFVTKTIFNVLIDDFEVRDLSSIPRTFPKWDKLLRPDIDWMALIWPFVIFSVVFISLGLSAFVLKGRNMYDIEFASGTSVQFDLNHDMKQADVLAKFVEEDRKTKRIPSPSVVSINNSSRQYEVVTPNDNSNQVREAVLQAMGPDLQIDLPSKFDMAGQKDVDVLRNGAPPANGDAAIPSIMFPITSDNITADGVDLPDAPRDSGGVVVILRHLSPALTPAEIKDRIVRASVQPGNEVSLGDWNIDIDRLDGVTGPAALTKPAADVAVLASDVNFPFAKSEADWKEKLAGPLWKLIDQGVNREAKLQKVSNFNPQVAGDMTRDALMATILSIIVIMIYIWVRFGNLKYGTATVVALLHDTLFVVGAVGMSHFLANTVLGNVFLVEAFRINLTLVAAILTVMSYSMIDTIVVFDRIRENRGKYGMISRKVINDSINQTLSRTLLTAGTTIATVATMYFAGGAGIHGFTFVLLVGILVGTYSSIAIAAPILLLGGDQKAPTLPGGQRRAALDKAQRVGA